MCLCLCSRILTGIANLPSKGVVLIGMYPSCPRPCQPRSLTRSVCVQPVGDGLTGRFLLWGLDLKRPSEQA